MQKVNTQSEVFTIVHMSYYVIAPTSQFSHMPDHASEESKTYSPPIF